MLDFLDAGGIEHSDPRVPSVIVARFRESKPRSLVLRSVEVRYQFDERDALVGIETKEDDTAP